MERKQKKANDARIFLEDRRKEESQNLFKKWAKKPVYQTRKQDLEGKPFYIEKFEKMKLILEQKKMLAEQKEDELDNYKLLVNNL